MDKIDKRNLQEKMKKSIIKHWRVNYVKPEQEVKLTPEHKSENELRQESEEEAAAKAKEVYRRLMEEARQDEERKLEEQRRAYEDARWKEKTENKEFYGQRPLEDGEKKEQVEKILSEKEERIQKAFYESERKGEQNSTEDRAGCI